MRELKFRAWDKVNNRMTNNIDLVGGNPCSMIRVLPNNWQASFYNDQCSFEVMQFTGLKDSKGIDVYEGDILQEKWTFEGKDYARNIEIKYEEMSNCGCCTEDSGIGFNFQRFGNKGPIEVIGNIFENPELLETI